MAYIEGGRTYVRTYVRTPDGQWRHNQNFSYTWVYQNLLSMGLRARASGARSSATNYLKRQNKLTRPKKRLV